MRGEGGVRGEGGEGGKGGEGYPPFLYCRL